MSDIFYPDDVTDILENKKVIFLGDSIVRALYKDLIWLINDKSLIPLEVNPLQTPSNKVVTQNCLLYVFVVVVQHQLNFQVLKAKGEKHCPDLGMIATSKDTSAAFLSNRDTLHGNFRGLCPGNNYVEDRSYHNKEHNISVEFK